MAGIVVRPHSRILYGHHWVYRTEVRKIFGNPQDGDIISVKDGRDRFLGSAIYNNRSAIVARRFSHRRQALDLDFFVRRLRQAETLRQPLFASDQPCRLVWSESDGLPGLVIDRFGSILVCQLQTCGLDLRKRILLEALQSVFKFDGIVFRGDSTVRLQEGLPVHTPEVHGNVPAEIVIEIEGVQFGIDVLSGQKSGFYLDQVANYRTVAGYARGRRVLDCFSNQGGFAFTCAKAGAAAVTAVESGVFSVEQLRQNARRNAIEIRSIEADVFDFLKIEQHRKREYDLIILDPPSFTKVRSRVQEASRGYHELHLRAAKLLSRHGILATFSCSHHVSAEVFLDTIRAAFSEARCTARFKDRLGQGPDHPILLHLPETEYLKGVVIEAIASF